MGIISKRTLLFYLFRCMPIKKNKIVISNFIGHGYSGEVADIAEELLKSNKDLDIKWLLNPRNTSEGIPKEIDIIRWHSYREVYELATAKVWVDNCRKSEWIRKRPNQYYIQTWHGDICLKAIEKDAMEQLSKNYIAAAQNDSKMADLLVASTEWRKKNYKEAFWYDGEILEANLYRDMFKVKDKVALEAKVRKTLGIASDRNIILYAPTFRTAKESRDSLDLDYKKIVQHIENCTGDKYCLIIRLHPIVSAGLDKNIFDEQIINGTSYESFVDLLLCSKWLISDYSGVLFDGFNTKTPTIIYAKDIDNYKKYERKLYFEMDALPAPLATSTDEICKLMSSYPYEDYEAKCEELTKSIGYYENDGIKLVAKKILEQIENE